MSAGAEKEARTGAEAQAPPPVLIGEVNPWGELEAGPTEEGAR